MGKKEFIVDISTFLGSSASPIFLIDEFLFKNRNGLNMGSTRIRHLGVIYAVFTHTVTGDIQVTNIPSDVQVITTTPVPINLGIAIKSERLLDFQEIFMARQKERDVT